MECSRLEPVTGASFCADCTKALGELAVEISLAGFPNGIESGIALLPAECGQFLDRCRQSQIVAKNGAVDVLGKALDQTAGFGKRGAALKEQARSSPAGVEQGSQPTAHP